MPKSTISVKLDIASDVELGKKSYICLSSRGNSPALVRKNKTKTQNRTILGLVPKLPNFHCNSVYNSDLKFLIDIFILIHSTHSLKPKLSHLSKSHLRALISMLIFLVSSILLVSLWQHLTVCPVLR